MGIFFVFSLESRHSVNLRFHSPLHADWRARLATTHSPSLPLATTMVAPRPRRGAPAARPAPDAAASAPPPDAAATTSLTAALAANRALQSTLRDGLRTLDGLLASNSALAARLRAAGPDTQSPALPSSPRPLPRHVAKGKMGPFRTAPRAPPGVSLFWRVGGRTPAPNADAVAVAPALALAPSAFAVTPWTPADDAALAAGALTVVREARFAALVREGGGGWRRDRGGRRF